ncbi:MAG: hypothetical protein Edafosvirus3_90 [Edafosvirus sp.]|uniref:DUF305 domain-containing protein n=1 Tax=Edafosvirus sp. TaxID=2487765 RepID=A0A3G4ZSX1_9VIRU|nr:MAG: hypothetical protein Edafosvirus3_90 [Edafosvirus sp.]
MALLMVLFTYIILSNVMLTGYNGIYNHLNKIYMALLMGITMILIDGIIMKNIPMILISLLIGIVLIILIRRQILIDDNEFLKSMIEHHDMALLMATEIKKKTKNNNIRQLADLILKTQQNEINIMKSWLN